MPSYRTGLPLLSSSICSGVSPSWGVEAVRSGRRVNNAGIAKMPPTTAMKAIALPGEARAMSKSLRSDGCGSGVTSERQCGQSLASSRMGSAQNGHKRLPRWLSADFERGVGSAKIRTQAIRGEISIARKNQPKPLRPLASAINPTASAKMNQNTNAVASPEPLYFRLLALP